MNPENDKAGDEASASGAPGTTTLIKTDQVGSNQKAKDNQGNDSDSEGPNDEDSESKSQALGDVWVFDTHLKRWMEIKAPLFI